jgi:hypothetical protein
VAIRRMGGYLREALEGWAAQEGWMAMSAWDG